MRRDQIANRREVPAEHLAGAFEKIAAPDQELGIVNGELDELTLCESFSPLHDTCIVLLICDLLDSYAYFPDARQLFIVKNTRPG